MEQRSVCGGDTVCDRPLAEADPWPSGEVGCAWRALLKILWAYDWTEVQDINDQLRKLPRLDKKHARARTSKENRGLLHVFFDDAAPGTSQRLHPGAVRWLIDDCRVPVNTTDRDGRTPLFAAIERCGRRPRMWALIVERTPMAVRARQAISNGDTAAHVLVEYYPDLLVKLHQKGVPTHVVRTSDDMTADEYALDVLGRAVIQHWPNVECLVLGYRDLLKRMRRSGSASPAQLAEMAAYAIGVIRAHLRTVQTGPPPQPPPLSNIPAALPQQTSDPEDRPPVPPIPEHERPTKAPPVPAVPSDRSAPPPELPPSRRRPPPTAFGGTLRRPSSQRTPRRPTPSVSHVTAPGLEASAEHAIRLAGVLDSMRRAMHPREEEDAHNNDDNGGDDDSWN